MAPKRRSERLVKMVVTAKKVVEETVKMVVTPGGKEDKVEVISATTKEDNNVENVEIFDSSQEQPVIKSIPVEDKTQEKQPKKKDAEKFAAMKEPVNNIPVQEKETNEHEYEDEDETQPASEPQETPKPPTLETPPKKEEAKSKGKKRKPAQLERKGAEGQAAEKRQRRRKRGTPAGEGGGEGYKRYVFRVMKQVHPDIGISSKAMTVINNLMSDMFERLANEAAVLQKYTGRTTMSSREVQGAVKLVLPGELGKHAIAEGTKAVSNYVSYVNPVKQGKS